MSRTHHEQMLRRGWFQAGDNRYLRRAGEGAVAVFKLASSAGGGWGWSRVDAASGFDARPFASRLSAAKAAEAAVGVSS